MVYDIIIIGAGAAGLWAGASLPAGLTCQILEKTNSPGKKLLMSGSGQCNLTHSGSIKDFLSHYGTHGTRLRSVLYPLNNLAVQKFLQEQGLPLLTREDGKVFPADLNSRTVLNLLLDLCKSNHATLQYGCNVTGIRENTSHASKSSDNDCARFQITANEHTYLCNHIIAATGGCSYPSTGSDGSFFNVLEGLGIKLTPTSPALVPVNVSGYPYQELSGISFPNAYLEIRTKDNKKIGSRTDDLLLTHDGFSGPLILNASRYAQAGSKIFINYIPNWTSERLAERLKDLSVKNSKTMISVLLELASLPKRFAEATAERAGIPANQKISQCSGKQLQQIADLLTKDCYSISGLGSFRKAMVTAGGVCLEHVNLKTMESKQIPGLYFAGEILDVDGDTGGYNLQFAFSSADLAVKSIAAAK